MKAFNIDYKRLVRILLPNKFRTQSVKALLYAFIGSLNLLYNAFSGKRKDTLYYLSITPQICYLEKLLNDRFDDELRRIKIGDSIATTAIYLYLDIEEKPIYLDNEPIFIPNEDEIILEDNVDAVVYLNGVVLNNIQEFRSLLDKYKTIGKKYIIK